MIWLDVDTAVTVPVNVVALIDDTDFKTRETAVVYDSAGMDLVWNFITSAGVVTQTAVTPTVASGTGAGNDYDWEHLGDGMYSVDLPASGGASVDNDAEGYGWFSGLADGVLPWRGPTVGFRAAALNDALVDGGDNLDVNAIEISGDSTAADNLELQYDTTGLSGDTFPATQSQIGQIANVSGLVKRAPSTYLLTTGTQSANTVGSTEELDSTRHEHTDVGNAMDLYYEFDIGPGLATEVKVTGYLQGNNDKLEVYGYDWVATSWKQIGTMSGQASGANVVNAYDLLVDMVGSGANEGTVRVRFTDGAFTLSTATLAIDQILVEFAQGVEGYQNGAVWLDTNASNTNTVRGVDGTATNPVSTIAAVNTLLASTGLARVEVAPQSSVTLAATQANQQFLGKNWTLVLNGQSISGSYFSGADVSGAGTGAAEVHFDHCHFGAVTLPPCDCEQCILEGTFTLSSAGNFFFEDCKSGVAGTSTPIIDFEDAAENKNLNMRAYSGGIEIRNIGQAGSTDTMSLEGWGQLVLASTCEAATIAIRGHFTITDNVGGGGFVDGAGGTLNDGSRYDVTRGGYTGGAVFLDTNASNTNTVSFNDGVEHNPVSTLAAAITIAGNVNSQKIVLVPGSSITLTQAHDSWIFDACHSTIALGGQSVNNAVFKGAVITGNDDGSNANHAQYFDCVMGGNTLGQFVLTRCYLTAATLTLAQAGTYYLHQCFSGVAGTSTPTIDFGSGLNASNLNMRDYSGGIEIENMGKGTGNYNMSLEGNGQLVVNANSTADGGGTSTVAIRGNFTVTPAGGGAVTLSDNARIDVGQINAECDTALSDYDGPTNTEMVAAFTEIKGATWASGTDTLEEIRDRGDAAWITATSVTVSDKTGFSLAADQSAVTIGTVTTLTGHTAQTADHTSALTTIDTEVGQIKTVTDALTAAAATKLAISAGTMVIGAAEAGTLSTTQMTSDLSEATDDHYNGRIIIWTSGVLQNQATDITDYAGASGLLTFTAVTEAPSAADTFIIV